MMLKIMLIEVRAGKLLGPGYNAFNQNAKSMQIVMLS